jgi:glutaconate CoA-transferase, subunit A
VSKVMTMSAAVKNFVADGDTIYIAGFTHAVPFSAGHEIIRQRRRDLTLCRATPDLVYDQMVAAGCARKVVFSWAGNGGVGLIRAFRRAIERGQVEVEEYTHFGMNGRLFAGASGLPFFPMVSNLGTDLPRVNPSIKTVTCPFTGATLSAVPALNPDVTIIQAQRADAEGNAHVWGVIGDQREAAFAAKKVILVVEEIVDDAVIRSDPNRTLIPGFIVSAVVEEPWGAHPSFVQGYYDRDDAFYIEWDRISSTEEGLNAYLEEWVHGVADRREYLCKLGADRMISLTPKHCYSVPVDYGLVK